MSGIFVLSRRRDHAGLYVKLKLAYAGSGEWGRIPVCVFLWGVQVAAESEQNNYVLLRSSLGDSQPTALELLHVF